MDFSPIIGQVWGMLGWLMPLMLLAGLLRSPWFKRSSAFTKCKTMQTLWCPSMQQLCVWSRNVSPNLRPVY